MYISDLIRKPITELLRKEFIGKTISFRDAISGEDVIVTCEDVEWNDDDGDAWVEVFGEGITYVMDGQGIDMWYETVL